MRIGRLLIIVKAHGNQLHDCSNDISNRYVKVILIIDCICVTLIIISMVLDKNIENNTNRTLSRVHVIDEVKTRAKLYVKQFLPYTENSSVMLTENV